MKNSLYEKLVQGSGWTCVLLAHGLLVCACVAPVQPVVSASQPTPTASLPPASVTAPTASPTPLPGSPSRSFSSDPQPLSQAPAQEVGVSGAELVEALQAGGYVIYIHSGDNVIGVQNPENCSQEPIRNEQSQTIALGTGDSFLALDLPVGVVLYSRSCPSRDTALVISSKAEDWPRLIKSATPLRGERIAALRQILSTKPQPGTNTVFVGHGLDMADVTGIAFSEGEIAIYKPLGKPGFSFVARLLPTDWKGLDPDQANRLKVEPYTSSTIPLEKIEPTQGPNLPSQSGPSGQSQILSPEQSRPTEQELLLPDLITLPPSDLRILVNSTTKHRLLRFTNSIMNLGPGKMELWGATNPGSGKMTVTQHVYDKEAVADEKVVGEFFFHPEHNHWHLGDFARYEIWSLGAYGEFDSVVALSNKVSYCLRDDARSDNPEAGKWQTFTSCESDRQGISVGWIDIYRSHLPGQSIDITFLTDGVYALRSTVDPDNNLMDKNPANNTAILYFAIEGNRVSIVEAPDGLNNLLDGQEE